METGKICPKCRQPIDGDEEYICCADAKLEWRCEACAKVSEGFAFPYGQCPACGGKLAPLGERTVESAQAMEAIRTAFEIELGGMAFYSKAAKEAKDPVLQELFAKFAEMEMEHMATLSGRYHVDVSEASEGFKTERVAWINRIRGLLAEFGLVFAQRPAVLRQALPDAIGDATNELGGPARLALQRAWEQWQELDAHLQWCDQRIAAHLKASEQVHQAEQLIAFTPATC